MVINISDYGQMATIKMVIFYYSIMSHLVKDTSIIYIGVPFPEEAPGTNGPTFTTF